MRAQSRVVASNSSVVSSVAGLVGVVDTGVIVVVMISEERHDDSDCGSA